jgi:hypothetical protein
MRRRLACAGSKPTVIDVACFGASIFTASPRSDAASYHCAGNKTPCGGLSGRLSLGRLFPAATFVWFQRPDSLIKVPIPSSISRLFSST